jgi:hypothetical protein
MRKVVKILLLMVVATALYGCFKDTYGYTDYRISIYTQPTKDKDFMRAQDIDSYAYYVDTTHWAILSYEDAVAGRITNKTTGEVKETPDVWGELNASDEYQVSLIINRKTSMLVVVDPQMQIYAYRKYELPVNLPQVDTKLYLAGWKPSHASGGWRVVNKFYQK